MEFITVNKARELIKQELFNKISFEKSLLDSLYHYTAKDIYAPIDIPPFNNSAMDGYCFSYNNYLINNNLTLNYTIQAGETQLPELKPGEAARIFTGAPIPKGVDTIVMQEKTKIKDDKLTFQGEITLGQNVRLQGSQTQKGYLIVPKNTYINAGIIGFLSNFGLQTIPVYPDPEIGILITGNELAEAGNPLQPGQIYESNSITLTAVLKEMNLSPVITKKVEDNMESTILAIQNALGKTDILLITGGISVGDYDYVQAALEANEVKKIFYKIRQKPGKPLFFGKKGKKYIFALPGNPASVLSCFHQYVKPFLNGIKGNTDLESDKRIASLSTDFNKNNDLTLFLKGSIQENGTVDMLTAQESYKMDSFAQANCLIEISGEKRTLIKGEKVTVWKI